MTKASAIPPIKKSEAHKPPQNLPMKGKPTPTRMKEVHPPIDWGSPVKQTGKKY